ncbi:Uncharacterised protein family UPF0729 [Cinara cedri]|uniref:Transmembrane protein n=1 Tax=Cinara cedri TaxID=506608 RepID=A0A5E4M6G4_9HEMI|nr:Uncharacterised protein family UPF0729 [Cinara cedri]
MVCIPCILVPLLLFLWGMIKPILNWFKNPKENSGDQNSDAANDDVCSLLSSCPCINKNNKPEDQALKIKESELLLKEPLEVSNIDKKNI